MAISCRLHVPEVSLAGPTQRLFRVDQEPGQNAKQANGAAQVESPFPSSSQRGNIWRDDGGKGTSSVTAGVQDAGGCAAKPPAKPKCSCPKWPFGGSCESERQAKHRDCQPELLRI